MQASLELEEEFQLSKPTHLLFMTLSMQKPLRDMIVLNATIFPKPNIEE